MGTMDRGFTVYGSCPFECFISETSEWISVRFFVGACTKSVDEFI
jgi:hypothetical protein